MIEKLSPVQRINTPVERSGRANSPATQTSFGEVLRRGQEGQSVAFSKHAKERAEQRGIQVDEHLMGQLNDSVERAQAKGATNILAFDTTRAFIINVPNGRVITTMSPEEMRDNIFTNIDGAVIL